MPIQATAFLSPRTHRARGAWPLGLLSNQARALDLRNTGFGEQREESFSVDHRHTNFAVDFIVGTLAYHSAAEVRENTPVIVKARVLTPGSDRLRDMALRLLPRVGH